MFSILHISDLHRSVDDNISNDELMSALVGDRSRYVREEPAIRPPDAIVISGDIIQGVPLGTLDAPAKIASQYATAEAFIVELTDRFLDGDRSKVVLIPGNHDIDWVTARSAMNLVGVEDQPKGNLASELCLAASTVLVFLLNNGGTVGRLPLFNHRRAVPLSVPVPVVTRSHTHTRHRHAQNR